MKKIKARFKKAIFAFFKDEILNEVGCTPIPHVQIVNLTNNDFVELKSKIILDERMEDRYSGMPISVVYERALEKCKSDLFEASMQFVKIDEKSIMDANIYPHREIVVSLIVSKNK